MLNMQETGLKISTLRKERNMTQVELADKIGVTYQAVSSWERGLTMPDISKLPDVSQVLEISIDELLGNPKQADIINNVLKGEQAADLSVQDLADVSPILKPQQVNDLAKNIENFTLQELLPLAPFIDREILGQFVEKAEEEDVSMNLVIIAPFLGRDTVDKFVRQMAERHGLENICTLAPFVSRETLDELVLKACEDDQLDNLVELAPFLRKETINQVAIKIESVHGIAELVTLAPFISRETLVNLAEKTIKEGNLDDLTCIAPFIGGKFLGKVLLKSFFN
ncbi:MAG: helix-turn-helix domain-containing protein [Turicibacter sp.]|nr:helix-turn-helix domain-containing protein [Turicibacter sp.]